MSRAVSVSLVLGPGATLRTAPATDGAILVRGGTIPLGHVTGAYLAMLEDLARGDATEPAAGQALIEADGSEACARWYATLRLLGNAGALRFDVADEGRVLASLTPASAGYDPVFDLPAARHVLSRFAHLRREGDVLVLDSPLTPARVELIHPLAVAMVATMRQLVTPDEAAAAVGLADAEWPASLVALLRSAGLVEEEAAEPGEDRRAPGRFWSFADLVFHTRSRPSRWDQPVGASYPHASDLPPLPALKERMSAVRVPLHRPDVESLMRSDSSLTRALEERRSLRRHGAAPIRASQVGEFLYRVARARGADPPPGPSSRYPVRPRIYPSGGACYPLEVYPVVGRCDGLEPGLYHYDPDGHELEVLAPGAETEALLQQLTAVMEDGEPPQLLLVLTARFGRTMWKYQGSAYALILKEVGVVFQSMYLVATAMGLAACALGAGEAARFADLIGADPLEEASVGEFLLGSRPEVT